ncbi:MAG TPA: transglutaminase N-terminal domain-containing protein, partial [Polyangia bacterium]|nr:transglutaminase N-terminal domain-containing protein [Polyangia bacterium]
MTRPGSGSRATSPTARSRPAPARLQGRWCSTSSSCRSSRDEHRERDRLCCRLVRFVVRHQTLYRYSVPVVLAPHLFRLTPRAEYSVLSRSLSVYPEPVDQRDEVDAFGNPVTVATFSGRSTDKLRIDSRFELDTAPPPASSGWAIPPLPWSALPAEELAPFRPSSDGTDQEVTDFARAVAAEAGHQPLAFLDNLCRMIFARADRHVRPTGDAQTAGETLRTWRGACRDYTVLFLTAARHLGMPARFCSGYQSAAE